MGYKKQMWTHQLITWHKLTLDCEILRARDQGMAESLEAEEEESAPGSQVVSGLHAPPK